MSDRKMVMIHPESRAKGSGNTFAKASKKFFRDRRLDKWVANMLECYSVDEVVDKLVDEVRINNAPIA